MSSIRSKRATTPALTLAVALASAALAAPAAAQQSVQLRLNSETGESLVYRFEQTLDIEVPEELGGGQKLESFMVVRQTTSDVRGDTLFFESTVQQADFSLRTSAGDEMIPDLSDDLTGQSFMTAFTRRGEPVDIEIDGRSGASEQIRAALRQAGFPSLPTRAVAVGDSWTDTVRVRAADIGMAAPGFLVMINEISLQRLSQTGSSTIADILVETIFQFEPEAGQLPGVNVEMTGSRADNVRFDVTKGHFLSARGARDFVMNMTVPGLGQPISVSGAGESMANLVES